MPRSTKSHIPPKDILEVRRKVVKACQRCRLKKCKCDGETPCTRCKSDDAICAYGNHKKSEKTVFRSGYVEMLERQHAQLIAGVQELYRRTQSSGGWAGPRLEAENIDQPLTHRILEALGVLEPPEWEGTESVNKYLQGIEKQGQDENGWLYSDTASPSTQAAISPTSPMLTAFPQSTIMSKRQAKFHTGLASIGQTLSMPPPLMASLAYINPDLYTHTFQTQMPTPLDAFPSDEQLKMGLDRESGSIKDWSMSMDDPLGNSGGQEQWAAG